MSGKKNEPSPIVGPSYNYVGRGRRNGRGKSKGCHWVVVYVQLGVQNSPNGVFLKIFHYQLTPTISVLDRSGTLQGTRRQGAAPSDTFFKKITTMGVLPYPCSGSMEKNLLSGTSRGVSYSKILKIPVLAVVDPRNSLPTEAFNALSCLRKHSISLESWEAKLVWSRRKVCHSPGGSGPGASGRVYQPRC